jgi:hypothetical protein
MARAESRTKVQIEANKLDLEMFRLSRRFDEFAKLVGSRDIDEVSRHLFGSRGRVRKYMHKNDIKSTES